MREPSLHLHFVLPRRASLPMDGIYLLTCTCTGVGAAKSKLRQTQQQRNNRLEMSKTTQLDETLWAKS
jgi:hypothetical protein